VKDAIALIESEDRTAAGAQADVANVDDMGRLVEFAVSPFGRLAAMHANAGIREPALGTPLHEEIDADWDAVVDVNGHAPRHDVGLGELHQPAFPLYAISKFAADAIVKAFAIEYGPRGIRATVLAPFHGMSPNFLLDSSAPVVGKSFEETGTTRARRRCRSHSRRRRAYGTTPTSRRSFCPTIPDASPVRCSTPRAAAPRHGWPSTSTPQTRRSASTS